MGCEHDGSAIPGSHAAETSRCSRFVTGMRMGLGPAAPTFVLGLTFGAAAVTAGWGSAAPLVFSLLAFSGSAQFTLLSTLSAGGALAAIAAALLINARYLMMSIALNDSLRGSRLWRAVQAQALADASFAVAHHGHGRFDVARLIGASVPQWTGWVTGTALGMLAAPPPGLMHSLGLDVAFPAFFLLLVCEELRHGRQAALAAVFGGSIAAVLLLVTGPGLALLGATAGTVIGAGPTPRQRSHPGGSA